MTGALVAVGTLLLCAVVGLVLRARNGRVREGRGSRGTTVELVPEDVRAVLDPAAAVTLVQLSTTFCTPCRHTRVLLSDLAGRTAGLAHTDIDLTDRPELAKALSVLRTPTTLAVDAHGVELLRVGGVPKREDLLTALRPHLPG
ncbi:thioredoxin family protein [Actinokineospora sp. NBRC 105648]|uniref:TlpA family protein disulfide reductase n=1 Tax=Actinokineospora sp. NBRC 105648 TaxID=3032206 RepID=UPI0024A2BF12|nr:thioredoxin family protein [Actinokineospora sp. NBRC 105648]GLZ38397.1 thiol reductase thioredoxin [Actinokineospora sp. NBRC 105648]